MHHERLPLVSAEDPGRDSPHGAQLCRVGCRDLAQGAVAGGGVVLRGHRPLPVLSRRLLCFGANDENDGEDESDARGRAQAMFWVHEPLKLVVFHSVSIATGFALF